MKKGFTLIELLAVIVILAIIAIIAVPIVLNIINDSKESSLLRSAEFYLSAAEYTIADAYLYHGGLDDNTYPITPNGDICTKELPCDDENTLVVEVSGKKPTGGSITITSGKITNVSLLLNEKIIVKNSDGELVYDTSTCKLIVDSDKDAKVSLGDEIKCGEKEGFYVIPNDPEAHPTAIGDNITLMAKYNLEVGYKMISYSFYEIQNPSGLQSLKAIYTMVTEEDADEYAIINYSSRYNFIPDYQGNIFYYNEETLLYPHVENYKTYMNNLGVEVKEASIPSYNQVSEIIEKQSTTYSKIDFSNVSFWTGTIDCISCTTAEPEEYDGIFRVIRGFLYGGGDGGSSDYDKHGIRVILVVPKSSVSV